MSCATHTSRVSRLSPLSGRLASLVSCLLSSLLLSASGEEDLVRFGEVYRNHLVAMDTKLLADVFKSHKEKGLWQTEFWGKYMHSAVPLLKRFPNAELEKHVRESAKTVMDAQLPDGYIGNYMEGHRANQGWDVWGIKYTLLGLLYYYDYSHEERPLACAKKLADWLYGEVGPGGKRRIVSTGCYVGMPSCSVLEPIVWLYRLTGEKRYGDFADHIVREVGYAGGGPQLVTKALAGIAVADRGRWGAWWWGGNPRKAYEMMSCFYGLLAWCDEKAKSKSEGVKGKEVASQVDEIRRAAIMTAEDILANEINVIGGGGSVEFWHGGKAKETRPMAHESETCVTITWMRYCEKLYGLTKDPKWLKAFRRSFFNVYLGAISPDGKRFASYPSSLGRRTFFHSHCGMPTDCCNQNGMRGFVSAFNLGVLEGKTPDEVRVVQDPRGPWRTIVKNGHVAVLCGELVMTYVGEEAMTPLELERYDPARDAAKLKPFAAARTDFCRVWREVLGHPWAAAREDVDIRQYGARTDATPAENAAAIQEAIDAAAASRGRAVVPAGEWVSGTLWLKSGVELHLAKGAVLKASPNLKDYNREDAYPENWGCPKTEYWRGFHFIICRCAEDVSITGEGTIHGNGDVFFDEKPIRYFDWMTPTADCWWNGIRWSKDKVNLRPGQLVVFVKCRDVRVEGVTIRNAPCWSLFFHGCRDVAVRRLTVRNGPDDGNADGVDVDCCQNVLLEDLDVETGDDGVTVRGAGKQLGLDPQPPCENVVVRRAKLDCSSSVIRIGVGDGVIRNVTIEDVTSKRGGTAVNLNACYGDKATGGVDMENITIRNCRFGNCRVGYSIHAAGKKQTFGIRNVLFDNVVFSSKKNHLGADEGSPKPENIVFK